MRQSSQEKLGHNHPQSEKDMIRLGVILFLILSMIVVVDSANSTSPKYPDTPREKQEILMSTFYL